jgi:hypothetical protein
VYIFRTCSSARGKTAYQVVPGVLHRSRNSSAPMATSVGHRARGAEVEICLEGPDLRQMLVEKMKSQDEAMFRVLAAIRTEPEQQSLPV